MVGRKRCYVQNGVAGERGAARLRKAAAAAQMPRAAAYGRFY